MALSERLKYLMEYPCREVVNDAHPATLEAVGGQAPRVFEGDNAPGEGVGHD
jgi:hypothetical protein